MSKPPSKEACQRGGWSRARQKAMERKNNPSPAEGRVRKVLTEMGYSFEVEVEIFTVFPQWIDIVACIQGVQVAIEVDGSHSWHNSETSKMKKYDWYKENWCQEKGIPLVVIPITQRTKEARRYVEDAIQKTIKGWRDAQGSESRRASGGACISISESDCS